MSNTDESPGTPAKVTAKKSKSKDRLSYLTNLYNSGKKQIERRRKEESNRADKFSSLEFDRTSKSEKKKTAPKRPTRTRNRRSNSLGMAGRNEDDENGETNETDSTSTPTSPVKTKKADPSRLTKLYDDGKKKELTRQELLKREKANLTFQPKTNLHRPSGSTGRSSTGRRRSNSVGCDPQPQLYINNRRAQEKRWQEEKIKRDLSDCSFKPTLYTSRRSSASTSTDDNQPRHEKLYQQALEKEERRRSAPIPTKSDPTFSPRLATSAKTREWLQGDDRPVHERLHVTVKPVPAPLSSPSFTPTISAKSHELVENMGRSADSAHERLYNVHTGNIKNQILDKDELECTFHPKLPPNSRRLTTEKLADTLSVHERLNNSPTVTSKSHHNADSSERQVDIDECTFQPKIPSMSKEYAQSSNRPVHVRLHEQEPLVKESYEDYVKKELEECTFTPKLNEKSIRLSLVRGYEGVPVHDRLYYNSPENDNNTKYSRYNTEDDDQSIVSKVDDNQSVASKVSELGPLSPGNPMDPAVSEYGKSEVEEDAYVTY